MESTVPRIDRRTALGYLVLFVGFWAASVVAVATHSNHLYCNQTDCPVTPRHPWLLALGMLLGCLFAVIAFRLAQRERSRWEFGFHTASGWFCPPRTVFLFWWLVFTLALMCGAMVPSAVRTIAGRSSREGGF